MFSNTIIKVCYDKTQHRSPTRLLSHRCCSLAHLQRAPTINTMPALQWAFIMSKGSMSSSEMVSFSIVGDRKCTPTF